RGIKRATAIRAPFAPRGLVPSRGLKSNPLARPHLLEPQQFRAELCRRRARPGIALCPRPLLGLDDEMPELVQNRPGRRLVPVELLDPLQPIDHLRRFVHTSEGTGEPVTCLCQLWIECVTARR